MTQEDKELLLKDICARLPYGLLCEVEFKDSEGWKKQNMSLEGVYTYQCYFESKTGSIYSKEFKPYLRPMSSMTEEEQVSLKLILPFGVKETDVDFAEAPVADTTMIIEYIDWLNRHHFDYRNLIEKKLALEAPDNMYK